MGIEKLQVSIEELQMSIGEAHDFAMNAPLEEVLSALQTVENHSNPLVREAWNDFFERIGLTMEYELRLKKLNAQCAGYNKYLKKMGTYIRNTLIREHFIRDREKNTGIKVENYGEYFVRNYEKKAVEKYPLLVEEQILDLNVGIDSIKSIVYRKVPVPNLPTVDNSFERIVVSFSEADILKRFGERNSRTLFFQIYLRRNNVELAFYINIVTTVCCSGANKQSHGIYDTKGKAAGVEPTLYTSTMDEPDQMCIQGAEKWKQLQAAEKRGERLRMLAEELKNNEWKLEKDKDIGESNDNK